MADPVVVTINQGTWTLVAPNVTRGQVVPVKGWAAKYAYTFRDTGGAAPTNGDLSEGSILPPAGGKIEDADPIDVYVTITTSNPSAGAVRVALP